MAKNPTPAKPKKPQPFKLATRWALILCGDLFDLRDKEKQARDLARVMYADDKTYASACRSKEIEILKVDVRPAKKK